MKQIWRIIKNTLKIKLIKRIKRNEHNGHNAKEQKETKQLKAKILIKQSHTIQIVLTLMQKCFNLMGIEHWLTLKKSVFFN